MKKRKSKKRSWALWEFCVSVNNTTIPPSPNHPVVVSNLPLGTDKNNVEVTRKSMKGIFCGIRAIVISLEKFPSSTFPAKKNDKEILLEFRILLFAFLFLHGNRFQEIFCWFALTSLSLTFLSFDTICWWQTDFFCFKLFEKSSRTCLSLRFFFLNWRFIVNKTFNHNSGKQEKYFHYLPLKCAIALTKCSFTKQFFTRFSFLSDCYVVCYVARRFCIETNICSKTLNWRHKLKLKLKFICYTFSGASSIRLLRIQAKEQRCELAMKRSRWKNHSAQNRISADVDDNK